MNAIRRITGRLKREWNWRHSGQRLFELSASIPPQDAGQRKKSPVLFFNASTRLQGLSLNAAFSILSSYGIQLAQTPVVHWVCKGGLTRCVLGTNNRDVHAHPPCKGCIQNSTSIFVHQDVRWFEFHDHPGLEQEIIDLDLEQLIRFSYQGCPLGELVLPSLRWVLRRHHLADDDSTCFLARQFILSAFNLLQEYQAYLGKVNPVAVVVFNGMFYPEAVVRWASRMKAIPVVTHEVGMQPNSAFFTNGDATAYPLHLAANFSLSEVQNRMLDGYLSRRFQGDFSTAGIKFWPEMRQLGAQFWEKASHFKQFVPIFTNVIFDTSQAHANVVFSDMFEWLDTLLPEIPNHPETLFVIRAHPDEIRPGKQSEESVAQWVEKNHLADYKNVTFIRSDEMISSYELIEHAKFVMVYNSTVGLEAAIKGKPVLCAGKARYTNMETVFFPSSIEAFQEMLTQFLQKPEIQVPPEFMKNARQVLFGQLFFASLPFEEFIESDGNWNGYVRLRDFSVEKLRPENSTPIKIIVDGILHQKDFLLTS
jgi:hypothetical protein